MIRAGSLDRTITIDRSVETISDSGAATSTFAPIATLRAKLSTISTSDILRDAGGLSQSYLIFLTRWQDNVTTKDQVGYAGASMPIKSIREIGRREGLEITVEAIQ